MILEIKGISNFACFFVYIQELLHRRYVHRHKHTCNFSSPGNYLQFQGISNRKCFQNAKLKLLLSKCL